MSHDTLLDAVHGQFAAAVIAIGAVVPDGPAAMDAGLIAYVQPSDWMMLNFCPETLMVALRGGPLEARISKLTVPLPCPEPLRICTHSASAAADHEHMPLEARTCTCPDPPDWLKPAELWASDRPHSPADWLISARWPLATMAPRRVTGSGLADAANSTVPSPWPLPPDFRLSHAPSTVADHAHSRAAVTAMAALPPSEGSGPSTGCIVIAQRLTLVGEVTEETLVEEEPQACSAASARPVNAATAPRRIRLRNVTSCITGTARLSPIRNGTHCQKPRQRFSNPEPLELLNLRETEAAPTQSEVLR